MPLLEPQDARGNLPQAVITTNCQVSWKGHGKLAQPKTRTSQQA